MKKLNLFTAILIFAVAFVLMGVSVSCSNQQKKQKLVLIEGQEPLDEKGVIEWLESQSKDMSFLASVKVESDCLYFVRRFYDCPSVAINKIILSKAREIAACIKEDKCYCFDISSYSQEKCFLFSISDNVKMDSLNSVNYLEMLINQDENSALEDKSTIYLDENGSASKNKLRSSWHKAIVHLAKLHGGCNQNKN